MIYVFNVTDQVDDRGYYVLADHHLVRMEMSGLAECSLPDGFDGDTLFELTAERVNDLVDIIFDSAIGPSRSWHVLCREVSLIDVLPCGPGGEPTL